MRDRLPAMSQVVAPRAGTIGFPETDLQRIGSNGYRNPSSVGVAAIRSANGVSVLAMGGNCDGENLYRLWRCTAGFVTGACQILQHEVSHASASQSFKSANHGLRGYRSAIGALLGGVGQRC